MFSDHRYNPVPVEQAIAPLAPSFTLPAPFVELIETLSDDQLSLLMDALEDASTAPLDAVFSWASKVQVERERREVMEAIASQDFSSFDIPY